MLFRIVSKFFKKVDNNFLTEIDFKSGIGDSVWLLYGLVRTLKPSVCVEIGSARGKSASYVGLALKEANKGHLYAIDPHEKTNWNDSESVDTFQIMTENLIKLGIENFVTIVRKFSSDAAKDWNSHIDLLFIDGDHSYEGVKNDWNLFFPYLNQFSVVVFHDTLWGLKPDPKWSRADMGVPKFVDELRKEGYPVVTFPNDFGISIVQPTINGIGLY